jgi:hypothetical protein
LLAPKNGETSVNKQMLLRCYWKYLRLYKATLLRELEKFLENQSRTLLVIDEAQNLSPAALEEVRMLTNLHVRSHPLLQICLLGQEDLRQRLRKPEMEQLHQRLMAVCNLEPLSLQETREYVVHRLNCAGWRGDPAISAAAFVLLHRFSQGLPRYINKLCDRLFLHGAVEQRHLLEVDDLVTVIREIQDEMLLPLMPEKEADGHESLPNVQALVGSSSLPADWMEYLTTEEQAFIERCPDVTEPLPMAPAAEMLGEKPSVPVPELAADSSHPKQALLDRIESEFKAVATREDVYRRPIRSRRAQLYITRGLGVVSGHSKLLALQQEIQIQQDALLAMQEREQMLALQAREAKEVTDTAFQAESQSTRAESKPHGFLGTLKNLFTDRKAEAPEQVFKANDR